jgi:hypothetical protein
MAEKQNQPFQLSFNRRRTRRLLSEKCLRNGFEKSNAGPWDFHVTAEKAMQSRTWLER